jgi:hypothetical protein
LKRFDVKDKGDSLEGEELKVIKEEIAEEDWQKKLEKDWEQ